MARYDFHCSDCGRTSERNVSGTPADIPCVFCGGRAVRQFPSGVSLIVPSHFRLTRREQLAMVSPPPGASEEDWDARVNPSQSHAPKQYSLHDHLEETVLKRERIELS